MTITELTKELCAQVAALPLPEKVEALNAVRAALHEISPFKNEPVDCVFWVPGNTVEANDYNPNFVAKPEMDVLYTSIKEDHFTMPIVTYRLSAAIRRLEGQGLNDDAIQEKLEISAEQLARFRAMADGREVVDGFHRNRTAKERLDIKQRLFGYLPVTSLLQDDKANRKASTVRHNRGTGEPVTEKMAALIGQLGAKRSNTEIANAMGMEPEEILRLQQVEGVAVKLANRHYDRAWEVVLDSEVKVAKP